MMDFSAITKPCLMISQTWPKSRETKGETLRAIEAALQVDYFHALQTVEIPYADERRQVGSLMAEAGIPLTYNVARVISENKLNLSDLDDTNRQRSCAHILRCMDDACESGAASLGLVSGPCLVGLHQRSDALKRLEDSLVFLCSEAKARPTLRVVIEPLDIASHKKGLLGTTDEAVALCNGLSRYGLDLKLCLDTAHVLLNGEDLLETLALALPHIGEYHYCNCVVDPDHPLFGDYHLPFGLPGIVDIPKIAEIMKKSLEIGFFSDVYRPPVSCEVLKREQDDSLQVMEYCRNALEQAWTICVSEEQAALPVMDNPTCQGS